MIPFHSFHVTSKQDYLHSIHFYSFPFHFKKNIQSYLIPLHSFLLLKYIPFHSILFRSLMNFQTKPKSGEDEREVEK